MENREPKVSPAAKTAMLIRRPVAEVFQAFIDPAVTTKFWFTRSTGRLEAGKQVEWIWEMYDKSTRVVVRTIDPNRRRQLDSGISASAKALRTALLREQSSQPIPTQARRSAPGRSTAGRELRYSPSMRRAEH
jgi:uncharacterized protein YndB with AHSA1/START domain